MSKFITITKEIDQHLALIFDHALKSGGFALHKSVQTIIEAVKEEAISPFPRPTIEPNNIQES